MRIKVSATAFSKNSFLREELLRHFPNSIFNTEGIRFKGKDLVNYFSDADGVIVGLEEITDGLLSELPNLKIIAKYGVGLDNIDQLACNKRNVKIGWTGGVNKTSVAEMVLGFMLGLSRNLYVTSNQLKEGVWNKSGGVQLSDKTIGIIGIGHIGKEVVRLLKPFGCTILVNDIINQNEYYEQEGLIPATKETIFTQSDIITIHTPLSSETNGIVDKSSLNLMKKSSFLINTARGPIIVLDDLKWALSNNIIAGAAIDVYNEEPPQDKELLSLPNLICTPHTGGNSYEAVVNMGVSAIQHLIKFSETYN